MTSAFCLLPHPTIQHDSIYGLSQITNSLFLSNAMAANDKLTVSNNRITTIINTSSEVVNTFFDDIEYVQVPVSDAPDS
ncbi:hypothetical protein ACRRTK_002821 [Alexandromys fortis]